MVGQYFLCLTNSSFFEKCLCGEVAEWLNAAVLKTVIPGDWDRGFESDPLHQSSPYGLRLGAAKIWNEDFIRLKNFIAKTVSA